MQLRAIRLAALKALVVLLRCAVICRSRLPPTKEEHDAQVEAEKQLEKERQRREQNDLPPPPPPPPPLPLADSAPRSALSSLAEAVGYFHEFLRFCGGGLNHVKRYVRDLTAARCDVAVSRAVRLLVEGTVCRSSRCP